MEVVFDTYVPMTRPKMTKLDKAIAAKERQIEPLEQMIVLENDKIEQSLKAVEKKTKDAETLYEKQHTLKQEMNAAIEKLNDEMETIKSESANFEKMLKKCKRHKNTIFKLMCSEWQKSQEDMIRKVVANPKMDNHSLEYEEKPEQQVSDYQQVFDEMARLTDQNLSLINKINKDKPVLDEVRHTLQNTLKKAKEADDLLTLQVNESRNKLNEEKMRVAMLKKMVWIHESLKTADEDIMLDALGKKVKNIYLRFVDKRAHYLDTLEMLCGIENHVLLLLQVIEDLPEESLETLRKIRENARRQRLYEEKLRLEAERQQEKQKRCEKRTRGSIKKRSRKNLKPKWFDCQNAQVNNEDSETPDEITWDIEAVGMDYNATMALWKDWKISRAIRQAEPPRQHKVQATLPTRYKETDKDQHNLRPPCLPPITKTGKAAKDSTGGGFGSTFGMAGSSHLSAVPMKLRIGGAKLPSIEKQQSHKKLEPKKCDETSSIQPQHTCRPSAPVVGNKGATMLQPIRVHGQKKIQEKEQESLPIRSKETDGGQPNLRPTRLPPIIKTGKAAKDSTGGGFGSTVSMDGSSHLSAVPGKQRISWAEPLTTEQQQKCEELEPKCEETSSIHLQQSCRSSASVVCNKSVTMPQPVCVPGRKKVQEKEQKNLPIRSKETDGGQHNLRPTRLPPIIKTGKAAKDSTGGGFGSTVSMDGSSDLSAVTRKQRISFAKPLTTEQQQNRKKLEPKCEETKSIHPQQSCRSSASVALKNQRACAAPSNTHLPPIRNAVKQRSKN
ncbi:uncharacterized protein [Trachinotus anak]|uniref:uncharacterized protein n=1 Tax=Trachinotus anak TaxID=443729 RepID=UPI0039F260EE